MRIALKPSRAELESPAFLTSIYAGVVPPLILMAFLRFAGGDSMALGRAFDRCVMWLCLFTGSFIVVWFARQSDRKGTADATKPLRERILEYLPRSPVGWIYGMAIGTAIYGLDVILWTLL